MNRLSARERVMAAIVVGIMFVLGNLMLFSSFSKKHTQLKDDLAAQQMQVASLAQIVASRELWAKRDAWLTQTQPKLVNRDQANVALLDQIKETAKASNVLLDTPPELGSIDTQPAYQSVSVNVQTKCTWSALVTFLNAMQQPDKFIVFESANLQVDKTDPTQMRGKFRIAKWYAP